MKKIYMILAAITLLSLSLNAQTRATENVTDHIVASAFTATTTTYTNFSGVTFTSDAVYAGNSALDNGTNIQLRSSNSNSGIVTTTSGGKIKSITITVARGTNEIEVYVKNSAYSSASDLYNNSTRGTRLGRYSTSTTINVTDDYEYLGIRSRNGAIYLSSIDVVWEREVSGPTIQASPSSVSMSAAPGGTATETVTVTGLNLTDGINYTLTDANGVFSVNRPSMGSEGGTLTVTYSPTAVGTHTATLTLSSNGAQDVTIPLNGTCATEVTVSDGTDTDMYLPVYGSYYDQVQMNQMIYPANMLSNLQGKDITSITFYPASGTLDNGTAVSGIEFSGGKVTLSLGSTTNNSFTSNAAISATVTEVASITNVQQDETLTAWTFTFDTPYRYEGGNLLLQVNTEAESNGYHRTFFYGTTMSNMGRHQCSGSGGNNLHNFLPKVTFTYEDNDTPALIAPTNGQEINVGESLGGAAVSKTITVSGRNLTEALTVSVSGTGFSVSPATLNAADVNNGTATVTVTYQGTANGTGTLTITSGDTGVNPVTVNLTATYVDITPVLTNPVDESTVNVGTNAGDGVSKEITVSGNYLTQPLTVSVTGTGFSVEPTSISAEDANAGTTITVIYNGNDPNNPEATGTLTISSSEIGTVTVDLTASYAIVTGGHMIRLAIPVVDQFYASTATNTHPRGYGYVLKYEPTYGEKKESGRQEVPVQHTGSTVNGYYTKTQVDNDTDRKLTTDIMSADVDMTLSGTNTKVFYNTIQGKANALPAEYANYYTVLQRQSDGTFVEMKSPSPLTGKIYQSGEYHYYDSIPTTGSYGESFKTYVPVVMTMGQDRRYYELDSLHNTYGAPIWKTGVGQVRMMSTEAQMQRGPQGSTQWVDNNNNNCSLYFLGLEAYGDLPSSDVSNIVYEPYMFRVWIQSASNNLRGCTHVAAGVDPDKPGAHWDGDGTAYGSEPVCVYEGLTEDGHLVLDVQSMTEGNNEPWGEKIQFGAVDGIDDLVIFVRFYYKSTGVAQEAVSTFMLGNRDGEGIDYYAAEGSDDDTNITTSINGVYVDLNKTVDSVTYVNTQGMKSDKPFDGVNIVITRYTDGSVATTKVVK